MLRFVAGYPMTTKLKTPEGRNEREGYRFDRGKVTRSPRLS